MQYNVLLPAFVKLQMQYTESLKFYCEVVEDLYLRLINFL